MDLVIVPAERVKSIGRVSNADGSAWLVVLDCGYQTEAEVVTCGDEVAWLGDWHRCAGCKRECPVYPA
jgi:hypothetical protein